MADYARPPGPPPLKAPPVPEGWLAKWDEEYKEWYYVNLHTKNSQWMKPKPEPAKLPRETVGSKSKLDLQCL
jgi:hypothetical protein